jgi:hypothetical protein
MLGASLSVRNSTSEEVNMNKVLLSCLTTVLLITACSSTPEPTATATAELAVPTPPIAYQIGGRTKNTFRVVVDPENNTDRAGLQKISSHLCDQIFSLCIIWFWDDINKAATTYPIEPEYEQTAIAMYSFDPWTYEGGLLVYTLGDK